MLTKEKVQKIFDYDQESGQLTRKIGKKKLKPSRGYYQVRVDGKKHYAHRIIYIWNYGSISDEIDIDHIDRDPTNNKIQNLRIATHTQNMHNRKKPNTNKSGLIGVSIMNDGRLKKFRSQIIANGKNILLGHFICPVEASAKYIIAKKIYHKYETGGKNV